MILVFGETGQVSTELGRYDDVYLAGRDQADLSKPEECAALIANGKWTAVINAAAYTAVDKAENEEALATIINGDAPTAMAQACATKGTPFVHISTDYVFDGTGTRPWHPNDQTNPQNAYGRSKLAGERGIAAANDTHAILRTSWVFSKHGNNFVKTMLRLGAGRDALSIVGDQIGGPTAASAIANACYTIAKQLIENPSKTGVYHFSGAPDVSWSEFADAIFNAADLNVDVVAIPSSAYPTPAKRPLNSRMDCATTHETFGIAQPMWRDHLEEIIEAHNAT